VNSVFLEVLDLMGVIGALHGEGRGAQIKGLVGFRRYLRSRRLAAS
jgi:hypothetical protein